MSIVFKKEKGDRANPVAYSIYGRGAEGVPVNRYSFPWRVICHPCMRETRRDGSLQLPIGGCTQTECSWLNGWVPICVHYMGENASPSRLCAQRTLS